ncbi:MAG: hypothetical protein VKL59_05530 [Nostocaceae cyanobacterium]|nr:hypothetical protein [Nostocaceae cyanobacterium]
MKDASATLSRLEKAIETNTPTESLQELAHTSIEFARLVASNPMAPSVLLRKLCDIQDTVTRRNVTANPNTPSQVLLKLGAEFPRELLANPIFPLLFLENPNLISEIPSNTLESLLTQKSVPSFFLEMIAKTDKNIYGCFYAAIRPTTPVKVLTELARHCHEKVRASVAGNPKTPVYLLEKLARDRQWQVRGGVANNPNTPVAILEQLAQDESEGVRYPVANNPNTPSEILEQLARDKSRNIRRVVANNPNTPVQILKDLAQNSLVSVRNRAISNINSRKFN